MIAGKVINFPASKIFPFFPAQGSASGDQSRRFYYYDDLRSRRQHRMAEAPLAEYHLLRLRTDSDHVYRLPPDRQIAGFSL